MEGTKRGRRRSRDFSLKPHVWRSKAAYEKRRKRRKEQEQKIPTINKNDFHDDLVATQILSRLPAKSLMRFKSVSKSWKSTIERDSHFIRSHRAHSQSRPPRLLTIVRDLKGHYDFLSAELDYGGDGVGVRGASIRSALSVAIRIPDIVWLGPAGGLICFVDYRRYGVLIYNVSTGQAVIPWIRSTVSRKGGRILICGFGFDPQTGEHKVVFVWHDVHTTASCEVLTVGVDISWRMIVAVPPLLGFIGFSDTYANGSIYWMVSDEGPRRRRRRNRRRDPGLLVAFAIGSEKFRMIEIPEFTLSRSLPLAHCGLIELDGCITVVRIYSGASPTQKLWKFHDRSEREDWSEVSIEMPWYISPWTHIDFHPVPGKEQTMIVETQDKWFRECHVKNMKNACFYCYNMVNKTFSKFEIRGIPSLSEGAETCCEFFAEDLFAAAADKKLVKNKS